MTEMMELVIKDFKTSIISSNIFKNHKYNEEKSRDYRKEMKNTIVWPYLQIR